MTNKFYIAACLAVAGLFTVGCSQKTLDSAQQDAAHNAAVVNDQAQQVEKKARPAVNNFGLQARVTAALQTSAKLPSTIHVRVSNKGDVVYLRGNVKTVEQKVLAHRVAQDAVPTGTTVTNDLKVQP